ncbi:M-phase inducer phosphatase-like [Cylas formicarius]|uniref:M-phase inducer phosphatase-like n=1 Tax=Cylas formicarius TaxID=197179 RepID=UPI002958BDFA|nr:M-phase inducer phosphatase-like [Cylas formicarius]
MWEAMDSDPCDICQYSRSQTFDENVEGQYINKENLCPTKHDDLSLYENASTVPISCVEAAHRYPRATRRSLEDVETISQDSGYAASYHSEAARFLSFNSPPRSSISFGSASVGCMEDDFLEDFSDVEPLDKGSTFPRDFSKLINEPLVHKTEAKSPKDSVIRPLFRRALSLQNSRVTPSSSKVRTSLFGACDAENRPFKRPDPPSNADQAIIKKSKLFATQRETLISRPPLKRAISATEESIMCAVQKSSTEPDLIGDFSRSFSLPLVNGKHQDLKAISAETLARLIKGEFSNTVASFKVIDCRYPYEFKGGHIDGAVNIYTKEQIGELLNDNKIPSANSVKRNILVFHCEFSSERGPNLYRYLRREDRQRNEAVYPSLHYPEIYLLEGGYKCFFQKFSGMCEPNAYKEMLHPDHEEDLRQFRQKSKTWNVDSKHRPIKSIKRL